MGTTKDKEIEQFIRDFNISTQEDIYANSDKLRIATDAASLCSIFARVYPQFSWKPWLFRNYDSGNWKELKNCRAYFDWLSEQLGIHAQEEWYNVTLSQLKSEHLQKILARYNNSLSRAICAVYSEYQWLPWKFTPIEDNFWTRQSNRTAFLSWFEEHMDIRRPQEWYKIKNFQIHQEGGGGLLSKYNNCIYEMLQHNYPHVNWKFWLFVNSSQHCSQWQSVYAHRQIMDWLADELQIETQQQWYAVTNSKLLSRGCSKLFELYGNSMYSVLTHIYPEVQWSEWHFRRRRVGFWTDAKNVAAYLQWLSAQLFISSQRDWYTVSAVQLIQFGAPALARKKGFLQLLHTHPNTQHTQHTLYHSTNNPQHILYHSTSLNPQHASGNGLTALYFNHKHQYTLLRTLSSIFK